MSAAEAFRAAATGRDLEAMAGLLAPEVVLHSPVTFHPFVGREAVLGLLGIVMETLEDFRYTAELAGSELQGLVFRGRVEDREIEGVDLLHVDAEGLIDELTVMVRPLSATLRFAERVGQGLARAGLAPGPAS
ncbi:MAG TPA: nuclear transport factor 2 family protein [Solirubrobacteraceae bacterium]|jgi:hypothetical protein|nr:nuclear transport factor 2 family protein [Solirubrobacteraceae bacterium]